MPFLDFPFQGQFYLSHQLFPLFANRVLPTNRPEFREYTRALGLSADTADPMRILARTGGRRETDQLEMFPLPVPDPHTGDFVTHWLLRGIKYMPQPFVEARIASLKANDPLMLLLDVQNEYDGNAIAVRTQDAVLLGYLPAYLTEEVRKLLSARPLPGIRRAGQSPSCRGAPSSAVSSRGLLASGIHSLLDGGLPATQSGCHGHRAMAQDPDGRCVREYLDDGFRIYHTTHQSLIPPRSV